jgi:hypothetical protein
MLVQTGIKYARPPKRERTGKTKQEPPLLLLHELTQHLKIVVDEPLTVSKSGVVWGVVYFQNGEKFFPERGWSDMAVPFLTAWVEALIRIAIGSSREETVFFMDGPFKVCLSVNSDNKVEMSLVEKDTVDQSAAATIKGLLQDAVSLSGQLLKICEQRGWRNRDTLNLSHETKHGEDVLKGLAG